MQCRIHRTKQQTRRRLATIWTEKYFVYFFLPLTPVFQKTNNIVNVSMLEMKGSIKALTSQYILGILNRKVNNQE